MNIGLFGGSFDPIHLGHLLVAQSAFEELALDRLFFVVAAQSPFKPEINPAPAADRLRLVRLALAGETRYEVDEQEINRPAPSYTIHTVRDYAKRFPNAELFYLIGADHVAQLPQWREVEELAKLAEFVIFTRPGEVVTPPKLRHRFLRGWPLDLSSSQIRKRVQAGLPIHNLVPPAVAESIYNNRLYH